MSQRLLKVRDGDGRMHQITIPQAVDFAVGFCRAGDRKSAQLVYQEAVRTNPATTDDLRALGIACYHLGDFQTALDYYTKALAGAPNDASLHSNIGVTLAKLQRFEEALAAQQLAVSLGPDRPDVQAYLGSTLTQMRRYEEAVVHCRRAVELDPAFVPGPLNLARALEFLGRLDEAGPAYEQAFQVGSDSPEARFNYALHLLRHGDFVRGFQEYEWRWRCPDFPSAQPKTARPLWDGSDLGGKTILIYAEQGLGDALQFVRYLPQITARNGRIILGVQPELKTLLAGFPGLDRLVVNGEELPPFDCHCPLLSLPRVLGTRLDTIPASVPYLLADPGREASWRHLRQPGRLHVGLVWAGSAAHTNDHNRSLPLAALASLADVENVAWFSLQKGAPAAQLATAPPGMFIQDMAPHLKDFSDTAAVLSNLDLLITVDTSVAHLAGALGIPMWLLLPYPPEWRWMLGRDDSPWYPSARLFRQTTPGGWPAVLDAVKTGLKALAAGRPAPRQENEADRRKNVIARKETDLERWSNASQLEAGWDRRAALAADFVPAGSTVLDLGCGAMALRRFLPPGSAYIPCDVVSRNESTLVCDFNRQQLPPKGEATTVTMLGVLEYIYDWKAFLRQLHSYGLPVVMSYCLSDFSGTVDRAALGWVNHLDLKTLLEGFAVAGFSVQSVQRIDALQVIFRLSPHPPLARVSRKVLVLSYKNVGNFGDRLGFHIVNSVLPPGASVTWAEFQPWKIPDDQFDLAIIGIGNSMFQSILTDELLALTERVPSIGIFGTQYRHSLDPVKFQRLLDRLAVWFARYEEDVLLYGRNRNNVVHMGDWLISQFGMSQWTTDGRLTIDDQIWADLPLDRTIQTIQQYREVVSHRVHPLLCALSSAERVAYREQREDGSASGASGKFRSMLLDVFGRTFPEESLFEVKRDAVAAYRARVQRSMALLPAVLNTVLGLQSGASGA